MEKLFCEIIATFLMAVSVTTESSKQGSKNVNFRDRTTFENLLCSNLMAPELVIERPLFHSKPKVPIVFHSLTLSLIVSGF